MAVVSQSPPLPCCFRPHCPEVPLFELETDTVKTSQMRSKGAVSLREGLFFGGTPASSAVHSCKRLATSEAPRPPDGEWVRQWRWPPHKQSSDGEGAPDLIKGYRQVSRVHTPMLKCVCAHMCAYRDKITTAHRKWGKRVRKGGMKSNMPWEPGEVHTHASTRTHTHGHTHTRQVGSAVKGHIRKLYFSDLWYWDHTNNHSCLRQKHALVNCSIN